MNFGRRINGRQSISIDRQPGRQTDRKIDRQLIHGRKEEWIDTLDMSLACPQDGIRVVSETCNSEHSFRFLASEGGTCPSLEEMGNKWI